MPISTFWNQVRLLTPALEPLITLNRNGACPRAICWPVTWRDDWALSARYPDATLVTETPPLTLVRTPLPYQIRAWRTPLLPDAVLLELHPLAPETQGLPDDRIWAAVIEVLAGSGHTAVTLLGDGWALKEEFSAAPLLSLRDHINWSKDNLLVGYPLEDTQQSQFFDTQTLYLPDVALPAAIALYAPLPAMATPAEWTLARQLGADVITGDCCLLALLAHFRKLAVTVNLRLVG